jgi:hypothetical protein
MLHHRSKFYATHPTHVARLPSLRQDMAVPRIARVEPLKGSRRDCALSPAAAPGYSPTEAARCRVVLLGSPEEGAPLNWRPSAHAVAGERPDALRLATR